MILMGFNPEEEEEEEEDPAAPSNSRPGPFIRTKTSWTEHGSSLSGIGTHQVRMCRSFHRAFQMSNHFSPSSSSRVLFVFPCFYREKRFVRPSGARQPPGGDPARRAATTTPEPGCVSPGIRQRNPAVSVLGGLVPGQGCSRCLLDLQSQRCCCNLTAPPPVPAPTNHSPAAEPSRDPIGPPACQSKKPQSAT